MQSMSENDFECFANTGVNTPVTMFPDLTETESQSDVRWMALCSLELGQEIVAGALLPLVR